MSVEGLSPLPVVFFGGLVTLPDPSDVPVGMSPDCADVEFSTGRVKTRAGINSPFPNEGTNKINGLKSYIKLNLDHRLLVLLDNGTLKVERTPGTLDTITTGLSSNLYLGSTTLFDREYIGFSQKAVGVDFPRYFDDVALRRIGQAGPGEGPQLADVTLNDQNQTAQDEDHELTPGAPGNQGNLAQAIQFQTNVTVTTIRLFLKKIGTPTGLLNLIVKQGNPDNAVNPENVGVSGTVTAASLGAAYAYIDFTFSPALVMEPFDSGQGQFHMILQGDGTYNGIYVAATTAVVWGADGTAPGYVYGTYLRYNGVGWFVDADKDFTFQVPTVSGVVTQGTHKCMCWFELESGYWTKGSPPTSRQLTGSKSIEVTNIPIGPSNVVGRRLAFTIADGEEFYHLASSMLIEDNTTTELIVDFTDTDLLSGTLVDKQLRPIILPPQARAVAYNSRLVWMGESNRMTEWNNLSFGGGFQTFGPDDTPLGWQIRLTGGNRETADVVDGESYKLTGNGSAAVGWISQSAAFDRWNQLPLIEPGRAYRVKARVKRSASLVAGTLNIDLYSPSGGIDTVGLQVTSGTATTSYAEYEAELTPAQTTIPPDLQLRVFADITPTSGEFFLIDEIEIWPSDRDTNPSLARMSDIENPEFYDGVVGFQNVAENNGHGLRTAFVIRDILYYCKERGLYATKDDGFNPPALWAIDEVSPVVGTPSIHGVGRGEDWVVIAAQEGAYFFDGGRPLKLTQEIDSEWRKINWIHGDKIWCIVHHEKKQVMIGVPHLAATEPDRIWMMDYKEGFQDPLSNGGKGRHWSPWFISANSGIMVERGTAEVLKPFFGSNTGDGEVWEHDPIWTSDGGAVIQSYYRTAFLSHTKFTGRQLFSYLTCYVHGVGTLDVDIYKPDETFAAIRGFPMDLSQKQDSERQLNVLSERVSFRFGVDALNERFTMSKFVPWARAAPFDFVRGTN